jgi:hypothetical protein
MKRLNSNGIGYCRFEIISIKVVGQQREHRPKTLAAKLHDIADWLIGDSGDFPNRCCAIFFSMDVRYLSSMKWSFQKIWLMVIRRLSRIPNRSDVYRYLFSLHEPLHDRLTCILCVCVFRPRDSFSHQIRRSHR